MTGRAFSYALPGKSVECGEWSVELKIAFSASVKQLDSFQASNSTLQAPNSTLAIIHLKPVRHEKEEDNP